MQMPPKLRLYLAPIRRESRKYRRKRKGPTRVKPLHRRPS
jgi:hypothetical protein